MCCYFLTLTRLLKVSRRTATPGRTTTIERLFGKAFAHGCGTRRYTLQEYFATWPILDERLSSFRRGEGRTEVHEDQEIRHEVEAQVRHPAGDEPAHPEPH